MLKSKRFLVVCAALAVSGCATGPDRKDSTAARFAEVLLITTSVAAQVAATPSCGNEPAGPARDECRNKSLADSQSRPDVARGELEDIESYRERRDAPVFD